MSPLTKFPASVLPEQTRCYSVHLWNESTRACNCQISMEQVHDLFKQTERNSISAGQNNLSASTCTPTTAHNHTIGVSIIQQNHAPPSSAACSPELQLENYRKNERITANFSIPPPMCSSHAQRSKGRSASTMKQGSTRL